MQYTVSSVQEKDATAHVLFSTELAVIVYTSYHLCWQNHQECLVHLSVQPAAKLQVAAFHANDLTF